MPRLSSMHFRQTICSSSYQGGCSMEAHTTISVFGRCRASANAWETRTSQGKSRAARSHARLPRHVTCTSSTEDDLSCSANRATLGPRDERLSAFSWAFFGPGSDLTPFAFRVHNLQCDFVLPRCGCRRDLACNVLCSSHRFSPDFDNNAANQYYF